MSRCCFVILPLLLSSCVSVDLAALLDSPLREQTVREAKGMTLFRSDHEDGSLEQMAVSMQPLIVLVTAKIISHWMVSGLPLVILSPVLGLMLALDSAGIEAMVISLLLGTPTLSLLGAIGAGLTVGLNKGGVLIAVLILPLYIPTLILGTALIQTAADGGDYGAHMLWMAAILALSAGFAPIATSAGVRLSLGH